jgi:hypothetical protein
MLVPALIALCLCVLAKVVQHCKQQLSDELWVSGKKKKEKKVGNFFVSVYRQYSGWMDGWMDGNLYKGLSICFVRLLHTERGCRPCKRAHYIIRILLMLREKKNEWGMCVSCHAPKLIT